MIVEIALLTVYPEQNIAFEAAWKEASQILRQQAGYRAHRIGPQAGTAHGYVLQVEWDSLEAHRQFMAHPDFAPFAQIFWHHFSTQPTLIHFTPLNA